MSGTYSVNSAFDSFLIDPLGGAVTPALVAWPNVGFDPPLTAIWYRASFMVSGPIPVAIGAASSNRFVGIYQIDVYGPRDAGSGYVAREAERLVSLFKRGMVLVSGDQSTYVEGSSAHEDVNEEVWFRYRVDVEWTADVSNVVSSDVYDITMTPAQMADALRALGYTVTNP